MLKRSIGSCTGQPWRTYTLALSDIKGTIVQFVRNFESFQVLEAVPRGFPIHRIFLDLDKDYSRSATGFPVLKYIRKGFKDTE